VLLKSPGFALECIKLRLAAGFCPDPLGELIALPRSFSCIGWKGKGRGGEGRTREVRAGEGKQKKLREKEGEAKELHPLYKNPNHIIIIIVNIFVKCHRQSYTATGNTDSI